MQNLRQEQTESKQPLRAVIELVDGRLTIYPFVNSDQERDEILAALDGVRRGQG